MKVPNLDRDSNGSAFIRQTGLADLGFYTGRIDNWWGPKSQAAQDAFIGSIRAPATGNRVLRGDGTWPWTASIDGEDILVTNARATCFGGNGDPQDGGETASGIRTRDNPGLQACSLPMDGRMFKGLTAAERRALDGSPIPRVRWKTLVRVTRGSVTVDLPVIDLGPAKRTGNAIDLTIAAARLFNPKATATNFEARVDFRILGAAHAV